MQNRDLAAGTTGETRDIYSVSRLNREVRMLLDRGFPSIWLEAEISNFARPSSGHWYFSLKDSGAQLRCAMFRQRNMLSNISPRDGQKVLVRGRVSLYEPRGDYQLIVDHIEDAGQGALKREFDRLKAKLAAEGLFGEARKRVLPALPKRIGVVTSPTGAAIRDILHVLKRRFPAIPVLIYPVPVQGAQAAPEIIAALQTAAQRAECDVLILARGGGSLEDLWAFNDEALARQIVSSPIPIVSAIGHEVDFTIADFVADVRAPTPSAAAEIVVPDAEEYVKSIQASAQRLRQLIGRRLAEFARALEYLRRRAGLVSPVARLAQQSQRLDDLEQRLLRALRQSLTLSKSLLLEHQGRLWRVSPAARLREDQAKYAALLARLQAAGIAKLQRAKSQFAPLLRTLHAVSPLATLERGYAIVNLDGGGIVRSAAQVKAGDVILARVARGEIRAKVQGTS
jgi:exodeoxyribonuclease VII large subunit